MFHYLLAKDIILRATYEHLVFKADYESFDAEEVHKHVSNHISAGYVRRILTSLVTDGLVLSEQWDETSPYHYTVSDKGLEEAERLPPLPVLLAGDFDRHKVAKLAPTSEGKVPLSHNHDGYQEIAEALDLAVAEALVTKPNEVSGDEHASIVTGLRAARELWNAFELTSAQIRVGLIMAIEDAQKALKRTFKLVKGPLLVEAIKAFFADKLNGFDL